MFKKIAILTAAAGMYSMSVVALAEGPTVHGRVSFGLTSVSGETDADDSQELSDAVGTRLGASGSHDLGNGMTASYLLEYGLSEDGVSRRHANISLDGSFGQFRFGHQTSVLYRYIGANIDQSWWLGGSSYYKLAGRHGLRTPNIAAYRFGAGPGGDDPITFDIQVESNDNSKAATKAGEHADGADSKFGQAHAAADVAAVDDDTAIDSVTVGVAAALGAVKLQAAYVGESGSEANGDLDPSLWALGARVPFGSAEIRGLVASADPDDGTDDNEAWSLLVMNDFGNGYFGMVGFGNYEAGADDSERDDVWLSLTKSLGGGLSAIAEFSNVTNTDDAGDEATTDTVVLTLLQSF